MQKKVKDSVSKSDLIKSVASKRGYSFVSGGASKLGDISLSYHTMFDLQKMNPQAQAAKDLIVKMIGRHGIMFLKDGLMYEDFEREKRIFEMFKDPQTSSWKAFKDKYYTNYFCSWMATWFYTKMGDWNTRIQVLDSRYIEKKFDLYWNLTELKYNNEEVDIKNVVSQIVKYDPDKPGYGMSIYNSVIYDAFSDREASKRNYMFFKNGAIPNIILTMDDDLENEDEINAAIDQFELKYRGTDNSHWIMALGGVKEIRTLDVSNRDLELLELRKFSVKVFGMLFGFDPRFLAFRDGENGSHSEYTKLATQSDKTMRSYADVLEEFMMKVIMDLYPAFPYDDIDLINDTFLDEETKIEMYKNEIQNAISTPAEIVKRLWKPTSNLWDNMHKYYMNIQYNSIDWLVEESESRTALNHAKSEEVKSKETKSK